MPQFIFVYIGGEFPTDPAEAQSHFEQYQQWLDDLGDAIVSPAVPFKDTHVVHPDRKTEPGSTSAMSGLSIIQMASMEDALAAASTCPFLDIQGTLEVSEMIDMSGPVPEQGGESLN